jgi:2'-5' RNA ligase
VDGEHIQSTIHCQGNRNKSRNWYKLWVLLMQKKRLFTAVNFSEEIKSNLADLRRDLQARLPGSFKWVSDQNFHLTLKFLGDVDVNTIAELDRQYQNAASFVSPFGFDVEGLGCFPDLDRVRVIWAGLQGTSERLMSLHKAVESASHHVGFAPERRRFSPHVTLARCKGIPGGELLQEILCEHSATFFGEQWVESFELMESELGKGGSAYTVLSSYSLI